MAVRDARPRSLHRGRPRRGDQGPGGDRVGGRLDPGTEGLGHEGLQAGFGTYRITPLESPKASTLGRNVPAFTSRATVRNARGRSMTALPTTRSGASVRLVVVGAEDVDALGLLGGLEDAERGGVGIVVEHVGADPDQGQRRLPAGRRVVEAVEVDLAGLDLRVDRPGAVHPPLVRGLDRRELDPAHEPQDVPLGQPPRHHAGQVARLLQPEDEGGHIALRPPPRGDDEDRVRVLRRHPLGRVLELEPVGEDQVVPLGGVGPERLVLLGGSPGLDVADRQAEGIMDLLEPFERTGIPGRVGDGTGGDQPDPHAGSGAGAWSTRIVTL